MNEKKVPFLGYKANVTILLLTTEYRDHIIGGLGRHVTDLTSEGTKRGITYIVVTISKTDKESYKVEDGVHVFRLLPWKRKPSEFLDYIRNINFRFSQFVLQELQLSFDLIHVHDWLTGIAGSQLKDILKLPLLTTFHATEIGRKQDQVTAITKRITDYETKLVQASDRIIVCSLYMKNVLINELGCPLEKLEVIPNGVIPKNYQAIMLNEDVRNRFPFVGSPFLFAMGRLVKEKGFQLLIHAFSEIHQEFPDFILVIAGKGPFESELKQLTIKVNLENKVIFTGFLHDLERNTLLKHCDMLVIPSLYEPFGIIALEGMTAAKPTVAFNIGGLGEILAEKRGILISEVNSKSLAEILRKYLSQPDQYQDIAYKGFQSVNSEYNWSLLIDETADVYKNMIVKRNI
jgi:glycosyltransferase involved in cell wall biosynthesis